MRIAIAAALFAVLTACQPAPKAQAPKELKTDDEKTLYALGWVEGQRMGVFALTEAELELVKQGLTDQVKNAKPAVDIQVYGPKINEMVRARAGAKAKADESKAAGEKEKGKAYAEKAASEPGAKKMPSGGVIKDIKEGTGPSPQASDTVKVHYKGTLTDGTEFDSSYKRNEPATFPLGGVIKCWTEGVAMMKVGGKAQLVCPSDVAYGDSGRPPQIPGGATLVFEVELLEIVGGAK